jgi:hypothetical protein
MNIDFIKIKTYLTQWDVKTIRYNYIITVLILDYKHSCNKNINGTPFQGRKGLCDILISAYSRGEITVKENLLMKEVFIQSFPEYPQITSFKWPLDDHRSRINFLNSLLIKEPSVKLETKYVKSDISALVLKFKLRKVRYNEILTNIRLDYINHYTKCQYNESMREVKGICFILSKLKLTNCITNKEHAIMCHILCELFPSHYGSAYVWPKTNKAERLQFLNDIRI